MSGPAAEEGCGVTDTRMNRINRTAPAAFAAGAPRFAAARCLSFQGMALAEARAAALTAASRTAGAAAVPLETGLKGKYPNLIYHVFDASSGYWRTRTDYPHYLLYREGDEAKRTLTDWMPSGPNPFCGFTGGRFTAPKEICALGDVRPGSKAVVVHPEAQARMERDPARAGEIQARVEAWFSFDAARNEAAAPGSAAGMSQAVAIGADGSICNVCSFGTGGLSAFSWGGGATAQASYLRMAKQAELMRCFDHEERENELWDALSLSGLTSAAEAKAALLGMLGGVRLRELLGATVAGIPTDTLLSRTRERLRRVEAPAGASRLYQSS